MQRDGRSVLQFAPIQSAVDEGFWHRLSSLKLNKLGVDDSPISITGFYAPCSRLEVSNHLTLSVDSFASELCGESLEPSTIQNNQNKCRVPGTLYNTNTLESFRALDRQNMLVTESKKIQEDINSGKAVEDPALLCRFFVISFADLKKWSFYYWFSFPALVLDPPATLVNLCPATKWLSSAEAESLSVACNKWRSSSTTTAVPFFLVTFNSDSHAIVRHLVNWNTWQADGQKFLFGFYDPCHLPNNPGWPLRNFLALISSRWSMEKIFFLCYRESRGFPDLGLSLVGEATISVLQDNPKAVGWELNRGEKLPRHINLSRSLDPTKLAISAADLNLKLMRWRALPSLMLDTLSSVRCLLLGAGTLGCQVARMLMAWGVRKITLLDSGKVSMSNPLRQSLYTLDDCLNGGEFKATAAVKNLERIFPAVEAEGVVMAIPMPGHPVLCHMGEGVVSDCNCLHDLIDSHDAVFLLTDTRESRWLPTLLCASANKIAITAALGFDSFLVMRHGAGHTHALNFEDPSSSFVDDVNNLSRGFKSGGRLGCYFCSDVVAPIDSTANRTLDQQCTVTRPGLAPIAASLAVELLIGILHHPRRIFAEGEVGISNGSSENPLGILPHQIRGSISQFSQMILVGYASDTCTACSDTVVSEYKAKGMDFIMRAINHPTYLEDLTGLTQLMKSLGSFNLDWDAEEDDECKSM